MTTATTLIAEIQRDKRFKATCPVCMEDFALADAVLFALGSEPPAAALAAFNAMRARIKERKQALRASRERMTKGARRTAEAVNLGMIVEKIVPSFPSFAYEAGDCRAMFADRLLDFFGARQTQPRRGALFRRRQIRQCAAERPAAEHQKGSRKRRREIRDYPEIRAEAMAGDIAGVFAALGELMGVCPCCGELFYVSEARPYYDGQKPQSTLDRLRVEERRLGNAEEKLDEIESDLRETAARAGLQATKRLLRKIDPVFSGAGYDPQDVKVIFNPVTYVVFDGMSQRKLTKIQLLAKPPQSRATELIQNSIEQAVNRGNVEFRTLRVDHHGSIS
jgi:predicted Holliday junction resolvase-like endonuclease